MNLKYYELDEEEKELEKEIEKGEWKSIKDFAKRKRELIKIAKNSLNKTRNINLRLSERDVQKSKAHAAQEGIPYQTYLASIIHKTVNK